MFPINFETPADAVKAIYEMKQSNPSAIVTIKAKWSNEDDSDSWEYEQPIAYIDSTICIFTDAYYAHWEVDYFDTLLCNEDGEEVWDIKSITITDIQSVEPKLESGDKVLVISENRISEICGSWAWDYHVVQQKTNYWHTFRVFPSRDLIKLPDTLIE